MQICAAWFQDHFSGELQYFVNFNMNHVFNNVIVVIQKSENPEHKSFSHHVDNSVSSVNSIQITTCSVFEVFTK